MAKRHSTQDEETEINITPMLDVVFIMLIFFIVTTSFIKETGIDPQRPEAVTAEAEKSGNILIGITDLDRVWMNKEEIEIGQIRLKVESAVAEIPESSAIIIADEKSSTGILIDVMDQIRLGGVTNILIAAEAGGGT